MLLHIYANTFNWSVCIGSAQLTMTVCCAKKVSLINKKYKVKGFAREYFTVFQCYKAFAI